MLNIAYYHIALPRCYKNPHNISVYNARKHASGIIMKRYIPHIIILQLLLIVIPVLAHDGDQHSPSDLEKIISGIGMLLIALSLLPLLFRRKSE